ncbi:hypothetical protein D3272_04200 [Lichenibacterium ramalinae]|uniref:Uncharacterized protein n=2 Tax=Lichenibacterium ramalinae TaxID=2316527 RepID=A0A4Q2RI03_9HYPH|nr:hypothetical protein D3272_04200 [Lichenibacterium ramalinae]
MPGDASQESEVDFSPLCQFVSRDGVTVRVEIYRVLDVDDGWTLEVIAQDEISAVWDGTFDTDEDAWAAFQAVLEAEGIHGLTETVH